MRGREWEKNRIERALKPSFQSILESTIGVVDLNLKVRKRWLLW